MNPKSTFQLPATEAVVQFRKAIGMTQQAFAENVTKTAITTVARWETGNPPPRGDALLKLARMAAQQKQPEFEVRFQLLYLDEVLGSLPSNLIVSGENGYLLLRLDGQAQIDEAIALLGKLAGPTSNAL